MGSLQIMNTMSCKVKVNDRCVEVTYRGLFSLVQIFLNFLNGLGEFILCYCKMGGTWHKHTISLTVTYWIHCRALLSSKTLSLQEQLLMLMLQLVTMGDMNGYSSQTQVYRGTQLQQVTIHSKVQGENSSQLQLYTTYVTV